MRTPTNPRSLLRTAAIVVGVVLLVSACGDDSGDEAGADPTPSSDATTTVPAGDATTTAPAGEAEPTGDDEPTDRSDELIGEWTITTFQLAGALGEAPPVGDDPATIHFADDGTFTFSTGCNTGEGSWEPFGVYQPANDDGIPEGQSISFDGIASTEIACDDERADQDLAIGGAIRATHLFILDGTTLTLYRDGNVMIEATR